MLADPRQVEHEGLLELEPHLVGDLVPIAASTGSAWVSSGAPPRLSSQFALQLTFMSSPLISDLGRATGVCSCSGAFVSVSYRHAVRHDRPCHYHAVPVDRLDPVVGTVSVLDRTDHGLALVASRHLADGAHVVALDPATHRSFYPIPHGGTGHPAVLEEEPTK